MAIKILGLETSCDETAAGVVLDGRTLLSNVISSQADLHSPHGGVVPEVASRQHVRDLVPVLEQAAEEPFGNSYTQGKNPLCLAAY